MPFAEIDPARGDITVTTRWNDKEVIKAIPGSRYDGQWHLPLSWSSCVALRGFFRDQLAVGEQLTQWAWNERNARVDPALHYRAELTWPDATTAPELNFHEQHLYPFQKAGVEFMTFAGDVLLGDEMGCGKTIQALSALSHRIGPATTLPALVICPNSVKRNWQDEIERFFPKANAYVVEGQAPARRRIIEDSRGDLDAIVIVNIEAARLFSRLAPFGSIRLKRCTECDRYGDPNLKKAQCETHRKELNDYGFQTVIFDEAHRGKDPRSKQTRAVWALMHDPTVRRRWALTGTPIAQHPGDLWAIMHAIAPYDFPVKSKFVERYCLTSWNAFGGLDIVGVKPDTKDELFAILDPHFRRMTKAIVLPDLPPKVRYTRYVDMRPAQAKMYKEMASELHTVTPEGALFLAPNQLTASTRLMQLAAAAVDVEKPDADDPTTWKVTLKNPSPKLDELEALLEDIGEGTPVGVAAEHRQLINLASARLTELDIPHALITGEISEYDRKKALDLLDAHRIRALLFTFKAGGTGLNMTAANTLIRLQRPWSMIDNLQGEDRFHRIGSERHASVNIIDIVTRGTLEEKQVERLRIKLARLDEITRDRAALVAAGLDTSTVDMEETQLMHDHLYPIPSEEL
jgi:SNF2 family DNA or RNA helicase